MHNDDKLEVLILREGLETVLRKLDRIERLIRSGDRAELEAIAKVLAELASGGDAAVIARIDAVTARLGAMAEPTTPP